MSDEKTPELIDLRNLPPPSEEDEARINDLIAHERATMVRTGYQLPSIYSDIYDDLLKQENTNASRYFIDNLLTRIRNRKKEILATLDKIIAQDAALKDGATLFLLQFNITYSDLPDLRQKISEA